MLRALRPAALRSAAALGLAAALSAPAPGQTTVYSSNGFETPTYNVGSINNQQGFQSLPSPGAGLIQTGTRYAGAQAFQIDGGGLLPNAPYSHGNFWYQSYSFANGYNPVGSATPFVQVQFHTRTSGALPVTTDIPFAGVYLEGYTAGGIQQSITPIMVNLNGGVTVFTNTATGGSNQAVSTADGLLPREAWNSLYAELNFTTQTFRVYKQGEVTPLSFLLPAGGTITDVPFRNTFGTTARIAEIGMLGFHTVDPFSGQPTASPPLNDFYIDNYLVTATATSQPPPVPEPGLILAAGAVGLAGWRVYRRRRAAVA